MRPILISGLLVMLTPAFAGAMTLRSPAFGDHRPIPTRYSCDGAGQSPSLAWSDVPKEAQSLALTITDPDAPHGVFTHWIVFNIRPGKQQLPTGLASNNRSATVAFGVNSAGHAGYTGMCPPHGTHRYRFRLYALDTTLDRRRFDRAALRQAMQGHIIARAMFTATYKRH